VFSRVEEHAEELSSWGVNLVMNHIGNEIYGLERRYVDSISPLSLITLFLSEKAPEANRLERSEPFYG